MLLLSLLSLLAIQLLGVMLPGPDFFMVLRSSLKYGRKKASIVALGIATGVFIYAGIVVILLDYLSDTFLNLVHWISLFGGLYLLHIAYRCYQSSKGKHTLDEPSETTINIQRKNLYFNGLFCNLSNPKVIVFFLSILPIFILKSGSIFYHLAIIGIMGISTLIWFSFVAYVMGSNKVRNTFVRYMNILEILFSFILIMFACFLFYEFLNYFIA